MAKAESNEKRTARLAYCKAYHEQSYVKKGRGRLSVTSIGYTNELLAAADLNKRCGVVGGWAYLNPAPQTKDDAFARTSVGWRTVQVKTAKLYRTKRGTTSVGTWSRRGITSDIIALIDDQNMRVRYVSNSSQPWPAELPKRPAPLCKGLVYLTDPEAE